MAGLLIVKNNEQLNAEESAQRDAARLQEEAIESRLAAHIRQAWEQNLISKQPIELEMLRCLRQRNGEYDPVVAADIAATGGSAIFMMLTATKCRAAASWIEDIMLPAGEKPWGLTPTAIPDIPEWIEQAIISRIQMTAAPEESEADFESRAGAMREAAMDAMQSFAKEAAEKMETKIEDQMEEGKWHDALSEFIDDFVTFPAAILKGPIMRKRRRLAWTRDRGRMVPQIQEDVINEFGRVSPFDIYPSPDATGINDGNMIERMRLTREYLYNCIGVEGYKEEAIREVLTEYGRGGLREWLWRDQERYKAEGKEFWWLKSQNNLIDGLHYWGPVQGLMLLEWGLDPEQIEDPLAEYHVDAILVGRHVIRAEINQELLHRRPYHKASFQKTPGAFWGKALPYLMRDNQRMCNAAARAVSNNMGMSSGPQVAVNTKMLPPGEDITNIHPWKIWQFHDDGTGQSRKAVEFFQPTSNVQDLMKIFEEFERRADDATNIPRYTYGNEKVGGAGSTASGLSMLMNAAGKGIKLVIKNIDAGVIRPCVDMLFTFNMLFDEDESIKGDVHIVARGASAILIREQQTIRINEMLAQTANPTDMAILGIEGRAELWRESLKSLSLDDEIIPDNNTIAQRIQQQAQQAQQSDPKAQQLQLTAQLGQAKLEQEKELKEKELNNDMSQFQMSLQADLKMNADKLTVEERIARQTIIEEAARWAHERRMSGGNAQ